MFVFDQEMLFLIAAFIWSSIFRMVFVVGWLGVYVKGTLSEPQMLTNVRQMGLSSHHI